MKLNYMNIESLDGSSFRIRMQDQMLIGFEGEDKEAKLWKMIAQDIGTPVLSKEFIADFLEKHKFNPDDDIFPAGLRTITLEYIFDVNEGELTIKEQKWATKSAVKVSSTPQSFSKQRTSKTANNLQSKSSKQRKRG